MLKRFLQRRFHFESKSSTFQKLQRKITQNKLHSAESPIFFLFLKWWNNVDIQPGVRRSGFQGVSLEAQVETNVKNQLPSSLRARAEAVVVFCFNQTATPPLRVTSVMECAGWTFNFNHIYTPSAQEQKHGSFFKIGAKSGNKGILLG